MGLIRYVIFGVIAFVVYKFLSKALAIGTSVVNGKLNDKPNEDVIEICPKCGNQKSKNHKC